VLGVIDVARGEGAGDAVELAVVEQRYQAVREVLDGAPVTVVAGRYGGRRTVRGCAGGG
jgi:hypothetical protein